MWIHNVFARGSLDKESYAPDEKITFNAVMRNCSSKTIPKTYIQIVRFKSVVSKGRLNNTKISKKIIAKFAVNNEKLKYKEWRAWNIEIPVPPCRPSGPSTLSFIKISYALELIAYQGPPAHEFRWAWDFKMKDMPLNFVASSRVPNQIQISSSASRRSASGSSAITQCHEERPPPSYEESNSQKAKASS